MQDLTQLGFQRVGHWRLDEGKLAFEFQGRKMDYSSLYAFVCGDAVKYIGKTVKPITQRMHQYQNPGPTQRTNIRNHGLIRKTLKQGHNVEVFVLTDTHKLQYADIPINMAAGLEDGLIDRFQPEWNMTGKNPKKPKVKKVIVVAKGKGCKYKKLGQYLGTQDESFTITYGDIENIIGGTLPHSAYRHKAWWANGGHSQADAWLEAGWRVSEVQLGESVSFEPA